MVEELDRRTPEEEIHEKTAQRLRELIHAAGITAKHLDLFSPSREGHLSGADCQFGKFLHFLSWGGEFSRPPFLNALDGGLRDCYFELTIDGRFRCYALLRKQYGPHPDQVSTNLIPVRISPETNFPVLEQQAESLIKVLKGLKLKDGVLPDGLPEGLHVLQSEQIAHT